MGYKVGDDIEFDFFYTSNQLGKTLLAPTIVNIYKNGVAIGAPIPGSAVFALGDGAYRFVLSGIYVDAVGTYLAISNTADATVDLRDLPCRVDVEAKEVVTVDHNTQAALAQFANTDTGEVAAVPGSVAQLSQGSAPATVAVGSLTQAALAQFANTDTGEVAAVPGSVAQLAQCNAAGFPAGAIEYTYTVTTPTLVPVEGAAVWISTNLAGTNIVWRGETDTFGVARDALNKKPWLDAGAYYFFVQRSGYSPSNPDLEIVS